MIKTLLCTSVTLPTLLSQTTGAPGRTSMFFFSLITQWQSCVFVSSLQHVTCCPFYYLRLIVSLSFLSQTAMLIATPPPSYLAGKWKMTTVKSDIVPDKPVSARKKSWQAKVWRDWVRGGGVGGNSRAQVIIPVHVQGNTIYKKKNLKKKICKVWKQFHKLTGHELDVINEATLMFSRLQNVAQICTDM